MTAKCKNKVNLKDDKFEEQDLFYDEYLEVDDDYKIILSPLKTNMSIELINKLRGFLIFLFLLYPLVNSKSGEIIVLLYT